MELNKNRLDNLLRKLDDIHRAKIELLYDINMLEEYRKGPADQAHVAMINLLNWIRSDLESIRDITRTLAEMIQCLHPEIGLKRKRGKWGDDEEEWMDWTARGQT